LCESADYAEFLTAEHARATIHTGAVETHVNVSSPPDAVRLDRARDMPAGSAAFGHRPQEQGYLLDQQPDVRLGYARAYSAA